VRVKLLLDENISPKIAEVLRREGVDACGVRDRGLLEASDAEVFRRAFAEDRVVVTANVDDFYALAHSYDLHAGVVLVESGDLARDDQLVLVRAAIAAISERGDLINTILWIAPDGAQSFEPAPR